LKAFRDIRDIKIFRAFINLKTLSIVTRVFTVLFVSATKTFPFPIVHMSIDSVLSTSLMELEPAYEEYLDGRGL
jgi:hypothetical protein